MEQTNRLLKYLSFRFPEVALNKLCYEFQEKNIRKEIDETDAEKVLETLQTFNHQIEFLKLQIESMRANDFSLLNEFKNATDGIHKHLTIILRQHNYKILYGAVEDIVSSFAVDNQLPHKIISIIFMIVNGTYKSKTKLINTVVSTAKPLFQVNIDQKRRLYYIKGPNIIVGADIKRKKNDHSDVLLVIEKRYCDYLKSNVNR